MQRPPPLLSALALAGIGVRLESSDPALADLLRARYAGFPAAAEPGLALRVEVVDRPAAPPVPAAGPFATIGGAAGVLTIEGPGFRGAFDERAGRGWIVQPADPAPLETFLTAILAGRLLAEGGVLLHAAAIAADEGARVFFGPSGAGKTTVTRLVGEGVITDEITAVRRVGGAWRVSALPWRGAPGEAELAGLFAVGRARETSFRPLAPVEAVRRLLPCVFFSRADGEEVGRFLALAGDLLEAVPAWEMRLAPDPAFWTAVPRRAPEAVR